MIESNNIFYFKDINAIGGVETFLYNIANKYHDFDITVIYKTGDKKQIERLSKYVRCVKYTGQHIKCKKAFLNYTIDIIDNIEADEYIQMIHTVYNENWKPYPHPKITKVVGVSQIACDVYEKLVGKHCELCYNPIVIENTKPVLRLLSATRLTNEKGKDRMVKLCEMLDKANIPYLWLIFTDDNLPINNPNVIYMRPQLNITPYMASSHYVVQLSDPCEGFGFTPGESLSVGTPVIVTDVPAFREIGVNETNGFILNCDMTNVPIKEIYEKAGKFKFKYEPPKDVWNKLLAPGKSTYQEELNWKADVICTRLNGYQDLQLNKDIKYNEQLFDLDYHRALYLQDEIGYVKITKIKKTS